MIALGKTALEKFKETIKRFLDLIIILGIIIIQSLVYFITFAPRIGYVDLDDATIVFGIGGLVILVILLFRRSIALPSARLLIEIGWIVILLGVLHTGLIQLVDIHYPLHEGILDTAIHVIHDRLAVILGCGLCPIFIGLYLWIVEIRNSENRFYSVISAMPVGVAVVDSKGTVSLYNDRLSEILHLPKNTLSDINLWKRLKIDFSKIVERHTNYFDTPVQFDTFYDENNSKIDLAIAIVSNRETENRISYIVVLADITARKQAEEEREQQRRVISLYTSLLTHDVGNDLQAVLGYIEGATIMADTNLEQAKAMLRSAEAAGRRMAALTRMFTVESFLTHIGVASMLREAANQSQIINLGLQIHLEIEPDAESARSPGGPLLQTAFENLFRNTTQHTGENPEVFVKVKKEGEKLVIFVGDTGPGISPDLQKNLFNRSDPKRENGLGLYLTKQIISSCGGSIELVNQPDISGASFKIILPVVE